MSLRLTTWNCNAHPRITSSITASQVFDEKARLLAGVDPDISIIQEIPDPCREQTPYLQWDGPYRARGVAVITKPQYRVIPLYTKGAHRSVYPYRIEGPHTFYLFAIWALPQKKSPSFQDYVREVQSGIDNVAQELQMLPVLLAGDFNSNPKWDRPTSLFTHTKLIDALSQRFNVMSAYHHLYRGSAGFEQHATYHHRRNLADAFHIDYCLVPRTWHVNQVVIGPYDAWHQYSDHCPITVDLEPVD